MKARDSKSVHRILGCLAVAHAVLLAAMSLGVPVATGSLYGISYWPSWLLHVWVGLASLWFLWPLILVLHYARSFLRCVVPIFLAVPFLIIGLRGYRFDAPIILGLPAGVDLLHIVDYFAAYRAGRAEAQNDIASDRLILEIYGFPMKGRPIIKGFYNSDTTSR
jgi:hypothetical protein